MTRNMRSSVLVNTSLALKTLGTTSVLACPDTNDGMKSCYNDFLDVASALFGLPGVFLSNATYLFPNATEKSHVCAF